MVNEKISSNSLLRAAESVRAKRAAERAGTVIEATPLLPPRTTTQVRARLNFMPDNDTLNSLIGNALSALARGVRWARGSILNLLV